MPQHVQPTTRTQLTWSPTLLRSALAVADGGNLRMLADLCDWLLADDRVRSVFETRINKLLGIDELTFEEKVPLRSSKRRRGKRGAKKPRSKIVKGLDSQGDADFWALWPESEAYQIHQWARLMGLAPVNLVWPEMPDEDTGRSVPRCTFWSPKWLQYEKRTGQWFTQEGANGSNRVLLDLETPDWAMFMPYGAHRPWALGLWRGIAPWVLLKEYARDDLAQTGENAKRLVVTAQRSNANQRKELADEVKAMGRNGVIALPDGFDLKLLELSAGTAELYAKQIEMANAAIVINVKGQNLTTEVTGGSHAAAKQHGGGEQDQLESDAQGESTFLKEQPLSWYALVNYGDRKAAPYPVRATTPETDRKAEADVINTLADAAGKLAQLGRPLDYDRLEEQFGVPFGDVDEDEEQGPDKQARATILSTVATYARTLSGLGVPVDYSALIEEFDLPIDVARLKELGSGQQLFQYHLSFGAVTKNEVRARLGMKPVDGGDVLLNPTFGGGSADEPTTEGEDEEVESEADEEADGPLGSLMRAAIASGFVDGQVYADAIVDHATTAATADAGVTASALLELVEDMDSIDDARRQLLDFYRGELPPEALSDVAAKVFMMAHLGGHHSARLDAPEAD